MNILIVGLGSIGQRHLRVLKKNLRKKVNFFTLKSSKNKIVIQDDFKFKRVSSVAKHYNVKKISISEIENYKINTAIISNPPNLHLQTALNLLKRKCNLLIEKPLSTSSSSEIKKIKKIIGLAKKYKLVVQVGYQLRFHHGIKIIKEIIKKKQFGEIINGYFHFGEYTGALKKFENFTNSIYVNKKKGGGALATFSHHLDLALFFLGKLKCKYSILRNTHNFKIDVEDSCKVILTNNKNKNFLFNLNFLDNPQENFIILNFQKGSLKWNYVENNLIIKKYKKPKEKVFYFKNFKRNTLFEKQIYNFLSNINNKKFKNDSLNDGYKVIKLIHEIKKKAD